MGNGVVEFMFYSRDPAIEFRYFTPSACLLFEAYFNAVIVLNKNMDYTDVMRWNKFPAYGSMHVINYSLTEQHKSIPKHYNQWMLIVENDFSFMLGFFKQLFNVRCHT